jgi:aspartate racemase
VSRTVIGILAGMGPRTSGPFLDAVLDRCTALYGATWDEDFPDIALYSLPTPFRPDRPPERAAMEAALRRGSDALARMGADFIAVPCNVAHLYFDAIEAAGVPVLHIVRESLAHLPAGAGRRTAILATRSVVDSGLYHASIRAAGGTIVEVPQAEVDALILAFKRQGADPVTLALWNGLRTRLEQLGTQDVVLACTDLAFCAKAPGSTTITCHDSLQVLADATVREFCRREGLKMTV